MYTLLYAPTESQPVCAQASDGVLAAATAINWPPSVPQAAPEAIRRRSSESVCPGQRWTSSTVALGVLDRSGFLSNAPTGCCVGGPIIPKASHASAQGVWPRCSLSTPQSLHKLCQSPSPPSSPYRCRPVRAASPCTRPDTASPSASLAYNPDTPARILQTPVTIPRKRWYTRRTRLLVGNSRTTAAALRGGAASCELVPGPICRQFHEIHQT